MADLTGSAQALSPLQLEALAIDLLARRRQRGPEWQIPRASERQEVLPLSFAQERLWLLEELQVTGSAYNMPLALRLQGQLCAAALRSALDQLVRRHETLRTRFELRGGRTVQLIDEPAAFD